MKQHSSQWQRQEIRRPELPPTNAPGYDEALLDEAINQTFPASDPPAATAPGSRSGNKKDKTSGEQLSSNN